jgi:hypothetical protein
MKRILTTFKEKWPEYLLEIFVLIIGIYGAFAVDNWNESRRDNVMLNELVNVLTLAVESRSTEVSEDLENVIRFQQRNEQLIQKWEENQVIDTTELKGILYVMSFDYLIMNDQSPVYTGLSDAGLWKQLPDSLTSIVDDFFRQELMFVRKAYEKYNEYATNITVEFLSPNNLLDLGFTNKEIRELLKGKEGAFIKQVRLNQFAMNRLKGQLENCNKEALHLIEKLKKYQEIRQTE